MASGIDRAILVGHSFGGGPTVEAALLAPESVRALVLVDAALSVRDAAHRDACERCGIARIAPLRDAVVATFLTNPIFTRKLLQGFIAIPQPRRMSASRCTSGRSTSGAARSDRSMAAGAAGARASCCERRPRVLQAS